MATYKVYLGYPGNDDDWLTALIEAKDDDEANQIAYGVWVGWGLSNNQDGSNYYIKKL